MSITIKRVELNEENITILDSLDSVCFKGEDPYPKKGSLWWIAYRDEDGIPVGFAGLTEYKYLSRPCVFLSRSGVLTRARGNGLQRRFIRARERFAKKVGFNRVITYTSYENIISANNLIACNYKLYMPRNEWGIKHGLYFEKVFE